MSKNNVRNPQNARGRAARRAAAKDKNFRRREIPREWSRLHQSVLLKRLDPPFTISEHLPPAGR